MSNDLYLGEYERRQLQSLIETMQDLNSTIQNKKGRPCEFLSYDNVSKSKITTKGYYLTTLTDSEFEPYHIVELEDGTVESCYFNGFKFL
jgi:hypothetical protein